MQHTLVNGGIPGSRSDYMVACMRWHVPPDADIVFVEFSANDNRFPIEWQNSDGR